LLKENASEAAALVEDLLINVTSFFRDPAIFDFMAEHTIAELVANADGNPIRLWVAGCSTGEETYTLAMLFQEAIKALDQDIKLQIFASDADAQAVAVAREGVYPRGIEGQISPGRLKRFFIRQEHGYRVAASLRASIVFAVQDVLADPPFSKLHMISCRNLMIYLKPAAQAKIIDIFHFALRPEGILLLGMAETIGPLDGRFAVVSKPARLYRKTGHGTSTQIATLSVEDSGRQLRLLPAVTARGPDIAELFRRLVLERYAPATVMVNGRLECVYTSGPIGNFLNIAPGYPTHDLLALLAPALRTRVKTAIAEVSASHMPARVPGGRTLRRDENVRFDIDIQPVPADPDKFMLYFITQPKPDHGIVKKGTPQTIAQVTALERELESVKAD